MTMSLDMFADSALTQPTQVSQTPARVQRTPSMTPIRSGRRRILSTPVPKNEPKPVSYSQPVQQVRRDEYYDLRNRQVPLSNHELWLQYGIIEPEHTARGLTEKQLPKGITTGIAEEQGTEKPCKESNFTKSLKLCSLLVLSAFLGAWCFAYIQHHLGFADFCPPQISQSLQLDRSDETTISSLRLEQLVVHLAEEVKHLKDNCQKTERMQENVGNEVISSPKKGILEELLVADLASAGNLGRVLATPETTTYTVPVTVTVLWFLTFRTQVNHRLPQTTIEGLILEVGDCWPFHGSRGRLVLRLHRRSLVTGVSLSHIPPSLSVSGDISSAPRLFQVLVHPRDENEFDDGLLLGEFEYNTAGPWRQKFDVKPLLDDPVDIIEFRFLTNHGHPNYTCVYRVHVHGTTP